MSIPLHLDVVVLATRGVVAGIAAAVLRGNDIGGYNPRISAAGVEFTTEKSPFFVIGEGQKINLEVATSYLLMDVRRVDLWLTLDAPAAERVHTYITHNGPPPNNFYRGVFPDPVVPCGFELSYMPSNKAGFDEWLMFLVKKLKPWRERIWEVFRDSS
ncbi:MAG: hypothetical protein QM730_03935 [Anaerolineales bacterium]